MARLSSSNRRIVLAMFVSLALAIALALAGELAARRLWVVVPRPPPPEIPPGDWPTIEGLAESRQPNHQGILRGVFFRTNSFGYRGTDWPEKPSPGAARVLLVGDSVTMGAGVNEEDRYSDLVPALLADDPTVPPVEIINQSFGGSDVGHARVRTAYGLRDFTPDVTVYAFSLDDMRASKSKVTRTLKDHRERVEHRVAAESPRSHLLQAIAELTRAAAGRAMLDDETLGYLDDEFAWGELRGQLDRIARLNEISNTCGMVFVQPRMAYLGPGHPFRLAYVRLVEEARGAGLYAYDAFPHFMWHRASPLWVGHFDPHPNAAAHAILAEAFAEALRALPERCWSRVETGAPQ